MVDFGEATVVGGLAGKIGGSGVNGRKLRGIYRRANDVIKTAKSAPIPDTISWQILPMWLIQAIGLTKITVFH